MDLDDELRRMFANVDDQLDVPVRSDADQVIVAGARRVRRRRIATATAGGAATVVALVVGGIALAGARPEAMPPAAERTTTPTLAPVTRTTTGPSTLTSAPPPATAETERPKPGTNTQPPPEVDVPPEVTGEEIGPTGFRAVRLGMTYDEVLATGMIDAPRAAEPGCLPYPLLVDGEPAGHVHISDTAGVEAIGPTLGLHTPEGVSTGWTVEQVKAAYPELDLDNVANLSRDLVPAPGNRSANYRLEFADGALATISLQLSTQSCYE